jgi:hypothetical protein
MGPAAALSYGAEACNVLAFLVVLPGACAAGRKWVREHRRRGYRPRHARPAPFPLSRARPGREPAQRERSAPPDNSKPFASSSLIVRGQGARCLQERHRALNVNCRHS